MRRPSNEQPANSAQTALASAGRAHGPKASGGGFRPEPQTQENISTAKGGTGANRGRRTSAKAFTAFVILAPNPASFIERFEPLVCSASDRPEQL
ncbi:hypothetical protein AusDCA_4467 [Desulfitobacterium sp. AusDCA]